ncbi:MAG: hypothetical protein IKB96_07345 [Prevotella sp.]|nr:hypothetical protein [Prevotella sp.]
MMCHNKTDANNSKQFHCPHCGEKNLFYDGGYLADDYYIYDFTCMNCGTNGVEYNLLMFDGYEYNTPQEEDEAVKREEIEAAKHAISIAEERIKKAKEVIAMYGEE